VVRLEAGADVVPTLNALRGHIAARGAPALWWVGPHAATPDLGARLGSFGLKPVGEAPGMALDLDALEPRPSVPAGLSITAAATSESRRIWARTAAIGTGASPAAADALAEIEAGLDSAADPERLRLIGYAAGVPVAAAALVTTAGVAGVYAVATMPDARKKGIGAAMTLAALAEGRRRGCRVGVLQSSAMGHPLYGRMGFRDVCAYRLFLQG
jgi:GNAT superfamily N-acetyltransferase